MPCRSLAVLIALACLLPLPAAAADCGNDASGFDAWLQAFRTEAAAQGISQRTLSALSGLTYSQQVIALDRHQGVFHHSFEEFGLPRIAQRINKARQMMQLHADTLQRIETQFGVPGAIVVAIWALETDFGAVMGKQPALRSLATLAYDCRRSEKFTGELIAALKIIDRGDLTPAEMKGAWAGELGQTQFLASSYLKFAVDFEGNGKRDLIRSVPDVLASTANYLKGYGWQAGAPFDEGSANFAVLSEWNKSPVYQKTIAVFAQRLMGGG
ncbi:MAG TPA: lytic murein transglycosylase [Xanthobacteraceae bacterium]|nr:lytic murein transglycosylase [Xanthobacteraceae bacterium]